MDNQTQPLPIPAESITGEVSVVTFRKEDTGYSVMKIAVRGMRDPVTMVGTSLARVGEVVTATGRWRQHTSFGRQFEAENITVARPKSAQAIEKYLSSGAVKGIGPAIAKRITAAFGESTFEVLDEAPHRLAQIKGISAARAEDIGRIWKESQAERQLLVFLAGHGILGAVAMRIVRRYGGATIEIVEGQPYRLAKEVRGIGFKIADDIALKMGMPRDAEDRVVAGLRHGITTGTGMGHCGVQKEKFLAAACELLQLNSDRVRPTLEEQLAVKEFMVQVALNGDRYVFDKRLYDAERRIAIALSEMDKVPVWNVTPERAAEIAADAEKCCRVQLAPEQRAAVEMALLRPCSILTGGPGTGKTSTLKVILEALRRVRARVVLGAPTGKAAKRMAESTGFEAATIARLIGMGREQSEEPITIECSILIIDEASMVDVMMLDRVLSCIEAGASILFVGDVDQLPSVAAGQVLADMIDSGMIPTTRLTQVFRQAATSAIIRNAHRINRGEDLEAPDDAPRDFYFIEANTPEQVTARITALVRDHIPRRIGIKSANVQVLSPMRKGGTGTEAMNGTLQSILNPSPAGSVERFGRRYGVGDRVLQVVNNYDLGVMNGESGIIAEVDTATDTLVVDVDGTLVRYPFSDLDQLDLAYAMTVHKSQGSQFEAVVIPVTSQHYMMLQRSIIYTAITRATRFCVLVGQSRALNMAIGNARTEPRITALRPLLESSGAKLPAFA